MAGTFQEHGALRVVEALADDVDHGQITDFHRAVKAEDGETIAFSFVEWPDKQTRDQAWEKIMADEQVQPGEKVLTSGGDQIFPKGLAIGSVMKVSRSADSFLTIRVRPSADLSKLEEGDRLRLGLNVIIVDQEFAQRHWTS